MANEQYAFLSRGNVPSRDAWQAAIDEAGFDLQLDPKMRPFEDSGFSPCKLEGRDSGCEIDYNGSRELLESFRELVGGHDYCISFRWGGDMSECACAMIASYALAKNFGATVSYEGEPPAETLETFLSETRDIVRDARGSS